MVQHSVDVQWCDETHGTRIGQVFCVCSGGSEPGDWEAVAVTGAAGQRPARSRQAAGFLSHGRWEGQEKKSLRSKQRKREGSGLSLPAFPESCPSLARFAPVSQPPSPHATAGRRSVGRSYERSPTGLDWRINDDRVAVGCSSSPTSLWTGRGLSGMMLTLWTQPSHLVCRGTNCAGQSGRQGGRTAGGKTSRNEQQQSTGRDYLVTRHFGRDEALSLLLCLLGLTSAGAGMARAGGLRRDSFLPASEAIACCAPRTPAFLPRRHRQRTRPIHRSPRESSHIRSLPPNCLCTYRPMRLARSRHLHRRPPRRHGRLNASSARLCTPSKPSPSTGQAEPPPAS